MIHPAISAKKRQPAAHGGGVRRDNSVPRSSQFEGRFGRMFRSLPSAEWPREALTSFDGSFVENAPLWYYVLAEAQVEWAERATAKGGKGEEEPVRLGTVGGRIVAETIIGLLWGDGHSYSRQVPNWKPDTIRSVGDMIEFALT